MKVNGIEWDSGDTDHFWFSLKEVRDLLTTSIKPPIRMQEASVWLGGNRIIFDITGSHNKIKGVGLRETCTLGTYKAIDRGSYDYVLEKQPSLFLITTLVAAIRFNFIRLTLNFKSPKDIPINSAYWSPVVRDLSDYIYGNTDSVSQGTQIIIDFLLDAVPDVAAPDPGLMCSSPASKIKKQWEPDVLNPEVDVMKATRDICGG